MRYDQPVYFVKTATVYNYGTGNHDTGAEQVTPRFANVSNQTDEYAALAFGDIKQHRLTVRLQQHHNEPFDHVTINGRAYKVDAERRLRRYHILQVSGL